MEFTSQQIAELINGKVQGNNEILVNKFSKIENAREILYQCKD